MGSSSQTTTFSGGTLTGTINGSGQVIINNSSTTLNGNIGSTTAITSLTVNSGNTLNAATNNNSIAATTISLAETSTLTLGTGSVSGATQGSSDGVGAVN